MQNQETLTSKRTPLKVLKRNNKTEEFNLSKIKSAISRCLKGCTKNGIITHDQFDNYLNEITNTVIQQLDKLNKETVDVEEIQNLVIASMWLLGYCDIATKYTKFREEKQKLRAKRAKDSITVFEELTKYLPTPLQQFQYLNKFARWNGNRRETIVETIDRVINFFKNDRKIDLPKETWDELKKAFLNLEVSPAMRIVQMAGPPLKRCNVGAFNCSYCPIDSLDTLPEILYILMQGTGLGFSVEKKYVDLLPEIKTQNGKIHKFVIEDSTEGWCEAFKFGIKCWYNGEDVIFDYSKIRPAGSILKTKGGRASGPEPLKTLLDFTKTIIVNNANKKLRPIHIHDIVCMIGAIVQVGGVRRSSLISLSDLDDEEMRYAKSGSWYVNNVQRAMANNSAVFETKPDSETFLREWLALIESKSGERGIFNRYAAVKHQPTRRLQLFTEDNSPCYGTNPCGEIILRPYQMCNLSIVVARPNDNFETLAKKVELATIWGTLQATLTDFNFLRPIWKETCERERLLGVDITGHADCPFLQLKHNPNLGQYLRHLKEIVLRTNLIWSEKLGIKPATAATTVKPAGDSSVLFGCGSGVHPYFARYYIRRVRVSKNDPIGQLMKDYNVPCHIDPYNNGLYVFDFPVAAPSNAWTVEDATAIDMLEHWLVWKRNWSEHGVSCTIYVDKNEWVDVAKWVYDHFDEIIGITFLPKSDSVYQLPVYEKISEEEYKNLVKNFPKIPWHKLVDYEAEDYTTLSRDYSCIAGQCEI